MAPVYVLALVALASLSVIMAAPTPEYRSAPVSTAQYFRIIRAVEFTVSQIADDRGAGIADNKPNKPNKPRSCSDDGDIIKCKWPRQTTGEGKRVLGDPHYTIMPIEPTTANE